LRASQQRRGASLSNAADTTPPWAGQESRSPRSSPRRSALRRVRPRGPRAVTRAGSVGRRKLLAAAEFLLQARHLAKLRLPPLCENLADRSQSDATRKTLNHRNTEFAFKDRNLLRDGRPSKVETACRSHAPSAATAQKILSLLASSIHDPPAPAREKTRRSLPPWPRRARPSAPQLPRFCNELRSIR
jgi:hypothetical protein